MCFRLLPWFRLSILAFGVFAAGCRERPTAVLWDRVERVKIGTFLATQRGNSTEGQFRLPERSDAPTLTFVLRDVRYQSMTDGQEEELHRFLRPLRLRLELFERDAVDPFYSANLSPTSNLIPSYWFKPNMGLLVNEVEPFLYDASPNPGEDYTQGVTFRHGRDVYPLKGGRLFANDDYRLKVTVLEPISLTNQVQVWLEIRQCSPQYWEQSSKSEIPDQ